MPSSPPPPFVQICGAILRHALLSRSGQIGGSGSASKTHSPIGSGLTPRQGKISWVKSLRFKFAYLLAEMLDVKIYSPPEQVRFLPSSDRDATGDAYQKDQQKKKRQATAYAVEQPGSEFIEIIEATEEKLDRALQAFQADAQARTQGIEAEKAPGLKIVLKDASGSVIRQLSGEEFLRISEASVEGRASGKIIDRKA